MSEPLYWWQWLGIVAAMAWTADIPKRPLLPLAGRYDGSLAYGKR